MPRRTRPSVSSRCYLKARCVITTRTPLTGRRALLVCMGVTFQRPGAADGIMLSDFIVFDVHTSAPRESRTFAGYASVLVRLGIDAETKFASNLKAFCGWDLTEQIA
ncbi:hypothetical protein EVAR_15087_1 [Eumeta japonica]|uniref:Uncharacterized protein n=1 Tax=Eumeta variegata TaxID=151549 RepID=A0A4C1UI21_EUMVA|nr:hypothetical protein EVAR_15087_1 [Eumeta japonica]